MEPSRWDLWFPVSSPPGWRLPKSVVTQRDLKSVKGWGGADGRWYKLRESVAQQEAQSENMGTEKAFRARD